MACVRRAAKRRVCDAHDSLDSCAHDRGCDCDSDFDCDFVTGKGDFTRTGTSSGARGACVLSAAVASGRDWGVGAYAMGWKGRLLVSIRVAGHARVRCGESGGRTRVAKSSGARACCTACSCGCGASAIALHSECCHSGNTVGVRSHSLVGSRSSRGGGAHEVNKSFCESRAQFNAQGGAVHAILGNCSSARATTVLMRMRLVKWSSTPCTRVIAACGDVASGTCASRTFSCAIVGDRGPKFY